MTANLCTRQSSFDLLHINIERILEPCRIPFGMEKNQILRYPILQEAFVDIEHLTRGRTKKYTS